jgi:hypothetical protein
MTNEKWQAIMHAFSKLPCESTIKQFIALIKQENAA